MVTQEIGSFQLTFCFCCPLDDLVVFFNILTIADYLTFCHQAET